MAAIANPARAAGGERRWDSLDALRGIAALLVLTFHCAQVSTGFARRANPLSPSAWADPWSWLKFTPLRLLVSSGPPAVVLFFALSGFVLALPFLRARQPGYAEFAVKRVCRIYLPFAFAILLSAALYALVSAAAAVSATAGRLAPIPGLSTWFNTVLWDRPLSPGYVARNLMMTGLRPDMTLDLVMWSLVHELRISLVFPVLFVLTRRWPAAAILVSTVAGVACTAALAGGEASTIAWSFVDTGRFVFLFVAGIAVAGHVDAIRRAVARMPRRVAPLPWVAALALMLFPGQSVSNYYDFVWGAGAVALLVLAVGSLRADRLLSAAPLVWLGRVSYSLYLVHVPLLIATVRLSYGVLPLWAAVLGVIPLALVCADGVHRAVEAPSMRLGRRLAALPRPAAFPAWPGAGARETRP
jgi:peptidoglycan/LPS O-acetylase OafA/YrhL